MNINKFKAKLAKFIGTMQYHRLSFLPVIATDGVEYFCRKTNAYWLFADIAAVAVTNKNKEFIVVIAKSKDEKCDVVFDDENGKKIYKLHYPYTDLPEGDWKFCISNYPTEAVVMLPSEH